MEYVSIIPEFPSNKGTTTVEGFTVQASASSGVNNPTSGFDKKDNTITRSSILPKVNDYIQVMFPKGYSLSRYTITVGHEYDTGGDLKTWEFQGLVDGVWTILHSGSHGMVVETLTFDFTPTLVTGVRLVHKSRHRTNSWGFVELSVFELVYTKRVLVEHENTYKTYNQSTSTWELVSTAYPTEEQFITQGIDASLEQNIEIVNELENAKILYYTDSDCSYIKKIDVVEQFSVYDYIGELPTVVAYTESTDDIIVSTTVEPFDIYDEFGDSVEVLYYTDDEAVTNADLILEANWSPVDELDDDFEVVTWTDEAPETAQRALEIKAVPKPQFIKLISPKRVYGALDDVFVNDISKSYRDEARYFIAGEKTDNWYAWSKAENKFVVTDASTEQAITKNGMTQKVLNSITDKQWRTWNSEYINIGIFLVDNPRDTIKTIVETVSFEDYLPRNTTTIKDTSLYILNTTAKIDISIDGNILKGILSDDDLTRVQYRVLLNNGHFYPTDGSFTKLGESPQNIELVIGSKDIKIDDWNTLKVEFQDFYGTIDYWQANFIGTYSGLMFKDIYGKYFSSEIGEVLQYLDFGIIIAGQTTLEHEIVLKNQYGYDVENVHLFANTTNFPTGMTCEFSTSNSPFIPQPDLRLSGVLKNNEEKSFFIRLKTELGSTPDANGSFDIIVRADKA
ncbi:MULTISPECIES: hypothetical protein [unclassified Lysinibacillus]|uniref:hypothetical protein n=1 Tax=unclassified Lysinibacillus TaxID=2636778 RepID=UPI00381EA490